MKKKPVTAMLIMGLCFGAIGAVFMASGTILSVSQRDTEAGVVGIVHFCVGAALAVIGVVLLILEANRRRKQRYLKENGRPVWCQVVRLEPNLLISINHRHPCYAIVRRTDLTSQAETYRSDSTMALRGREDLVGRNVRVYLGDNPRKDYYVDIAGLLE